MTRPPKRITYSTPMRVFRKLDAEFHFTLDGCATKRNAKCARYFTPQLSLLLSWEGETVFLNPPYGREIWKWMKKAWVSRAVVVALIPSRTNPPWWHDYVMKAAEWKIVRKKMSFVGKKRGVPFFGSVIVVFRPGHEGPPKISSWEQP